jgi:hypothetical protein
MHTNLNVSVVEFNRRSVRPHLEFAQLADWHVLQCTYPLSWNQEAGIAARDDLNGIPLGHVPDSLRPNLSLGLNSAGGKRRGILGITDLLYIRRHSFTCTLVPSRKIRRTCSFAGSYSALAICFAFGTSFERSSTFPALLTMAHWLAKQVVPRVNHPLRRQSGRRARTSLKRRFTTRCRGTFLTGAMLMSSTALSRYENLTRAIQPSPRCRAWTCAGQ